MRFIKALVLALSGVAASFPIILQALPGHAQAVQDRASLLEGALEALAIAPVMQVMRIEGLEYGTQMDAEMFNGDGGAPWAATIAGIYDESAMTVLFKARFDSAIGDDPQTLRDTVVFFGSPLGRKITGLEIEARRALMDAGVKSAAEDHARDMMAKGGTRASALQEFADVNGIVDANVAGALNANLAFFRGMAEAGGLADDASDARMLADARDQEPQIRAEAEAWLFPYLALAYGPLSDEELRRYIDFSQTATGRSLNAALFAGFDAVFTPISRDLGRAAALRLQGDDI